MRGIQAQIEAYKVALIGAKAQVAWCKALLPGSVAPQVTQSHLEFHERRVVGLETAIETLEEALDTMGAVTGAK